MVIQDKIGLGIKYLREIWGSSIANKLVRPCLGWFGHVRRRPIEALEGG